MELEPKIASASWTELDEVSLDTFSTTAAIVVSDPVAYPLVIAEAATLDTKATDYHKALSRYVQFGGSDNRDAKDVAKAFLYKAHVNLTTKLEATAEGNEDYLTQPGYRIEQRGGTPKTARVAQPVARKAISQNVRGRVNFILVAENPREIKGVVGRRSLDNGVTWENGIYNFGLNFILDDQPSGMAVLYQFKFKATYNRESYWSESIRVEIF